MHITTTPRPLSPQQPEIYTFSSPNKIHSQVSHTYNTSEEITPLVLSEASTKITLNKGHVNWFRAVIADDVKTVKTLINTGVDVNIQGPDKYPALVHALFGNLEGEPNFEMALEIFKAKDLKIDKSNTGCFYSTLLVLKQYQDRANLLLKYQEIIKKEPEFSSLLEKTKSDVDVVSEFYTTKETEQWQEASGNVMSPPQLTGTKKNWFEAIQNSDTATINDMIQSTQNINIPDHLGRTALWLAAYKGDVAILETLLACDGLTIDKHTAGEFHTDLSVIRSCLISGKVDNEEIRKALTELTTDPYPSVYAPLLEKVGGALPHPTSTINRLTQSFISAICVKTGFRS
jgi:ankyrin repeat protein